VVDGCPGKSLGKKMPITRRPISPIKELFSKLVSQPEDPKAAHPFVPEPMDEYSSIKIPEPPPVEISDPSGKLSGEYDGILLRRIRDEAKLAGVDPLTALAIAGQESTFGRYDAQNPLRLNYDVHGRPDDPLQASMSYLKQRTDRQRQFTPDDEELILQSYNGLGRIHGGSEIAPEEKMYEGQTDLHGAKDRPYGKAVLKLREMLATQPSIQSLLRR
jgi:hypothetical protein